MPTSNATGTPIRLGSAHDGVGNGKRRTLRKPQPRVVEPRHPKQQPIQKARRPYLEHKLALDAQTLSSILEESAVDVGSLIDDLRA